MANRKYHDFFEGYKFYHVYNRTINKEVCYKSPGNYSYFLKRFREYISPHTLTYAYCLMPTHYHFLLQVNDGVSNDFLERQFKDFLSGYALAFNKELKRHGSLFQKGFKRIHVDSEGYLAMLIHYIHHNPIHHGYATDFSKWKYSSYNAILSEKPTLVCRNQVLELFRNKEEFVRFHQENKDYHLIEKFI